MARQEQLLVSRGLGVDNVEGQANCGQVQHALASVGDTNDPLTRRRAIDVTARRIERREVALAHIPRRLVIGETEVETGQQALIQRRDDAVEVTH